MTNKGMIAPGSVVLGDVELEEDVNVWYMTVIRGDNEPIRIGKGSNVQEGCVIHNSPGFPVHVGENVTIGHKVVVHGCSIGDNTLIGMGSIVMDGAQVGKNCIIGAGSLVTQGTIIPDGMMAFGSPAKVKRPLTEKEIMINTLTAEHYVAAAKKELV
ncbi:MAG: gamma carbonic anhydrase family protein [Lachnospiraceae bacterium]|nr:gamma carbonic anhydrase family protein [Candidatus Equihabitans merdae]